MTSAAIVMPRCSCQCQEECIVSDCKLPGKGYSLDRYRCDKTEVFFQGWHQKMTLDDCPSAVGPQFGVRKPGVAVPRPPGAFQKPNATAMFVKGNEAGTNTFRQPFGTTQARSHPTLPRLPTPNSHALTTTRRNSGPSHNDFRRVDFETAGRRALSQSALAQRRTEGGSVEIGSAASPHQCTANAAVRVLGVQGDLSPPCERLFKWVSAREYL